MVFKKLLFFCLLALASQVSSANFAYASSFSGVYSGEYQITMRAAPTGAILGKGVKKASWQWDFDSGTAQISGTTLSVGFNYAIHDLYNADPEGETLYFDDNGDGTYTVHYSLQIYHPGLGNPMASTSTTFRITEVNYGLEIVTIDAEQGELDGIPGTQIPGVFPLTIEPDMRGIAVQEGVDNNGDGLTDKQALALGLDPSTSDTDKDGIDDRDELGADINNPLDTDKDGLIDALEYGDSARSPHLGTGLSLISADSLSLSVNPSWKLSAIAAGNMRKEVDNITDNKDIANTDSTLGDPGLNYDLGNISFTLSQVAEAEVLGAVKVRLTLSRPLPDKLLVYSIEPRGGSENYSLMPTSSWSIIDSNTLEISVMDGGDRDIDGEQNQRLSLSIAITGNNIGDVKRTEHHGITGGSLGSTLILLLLPLLYRVYHRRSQIVS